MAVVNVNNLLTGKDSRWLQLEVCREFQRNKCTRPDTECKFAHPPTNVEVLNGRVTACYDSIKGRCNRDKPPCKYFHPPQHLKDQLLVNGRNHLALKNAMLQHFGLTHHGQTIVPTNQVPTVDLAGKLQFSGSAAAAATALALGQPQLGLMSSPYLPGVTQVGSGFNPYFSAAPMMPSTAAALLGGTDPNNPLSMAVQQTVVTQQKMPRTDRLEVCREFLRGNCKRSECRFAHPGENVTCASPDGTVSVIICMDSLKGRCCRNPCRYFHPPLHLHAAIKASQLPNTAVGFAALTADTGRKRPHDSDDNNMLMAFPGIMPPYKRNALGGDKSGMPVYHQQSTAAAAAYQQLLQPSLVPVSFSSAPPGMPRF